MDGSAIFIRRASAADAPEIYDLVHSEHLDPNSLHWPNFTVASSEGHIVGAVQMRKHADGSRELGSLVVVEALRHRGIAHAMIDALLAEDDQPCWMITTQAYARAYRRWGFRPIEPAEAPVRVRRNWRIGSLVGLIAPLLLRARHRLVILERLPLAIKRPAARELGHGHRPVLI